MKLLIFIAGLFVSTFAFSQNNIVGKWKPVYFSMDNILTGDVKAGTYNLSDTVDILFKDDKDPASSKKMMEFFGEMLLEQMTNTLEEYTAIDNYIETDTKRNKTRAGKYTFDVSGNLLVKEVGNKKDSFKVSFKAGHLVLDGELMSSNGKKGVMEVEYERL